MKNKKTIIFVLPLACFIGLVFFLFIGLQKDPSVVPSPFIGKPAPSFTLKQLDKTGYINPVHTYVGNPWLLNIWASWCVACRQEHPLLVQLRQQLPNLTLIGLNYKDSEEEALQWLRDFTDPYTLSLEDKDGRAGIELGVYGVPETFVIDKKGIIRYKHIGPLSNENLNTIIIPLIHKLYLE